ncbi:DNA internalization-related competence protein ComEC/Rec2 [Methylicorpusculum sp.]|uniref:DNA internalization-related competence protein ComEC/Rec2 n=1 Tax=Methylicorpusculum sp. TaxID=2713644 RepID=UPI0027306B79|nr:DNA internalization-related competence protein ComEC/Rec2 [Methylicorpusculum sp.]MDP2176941.1 DNA internalization-related competence protein ComEC/Rec2 [Methylicorpusculum sp.]MDP3528711.1 DNA internalization-related competence protein ComEC/Rec2 [Methylicorpusculum sp.]MDZ4153424.1 DNA internalization-related competence protein ComEC/Rec2 [Methylicorpusculum sp.]
MVTLVLIFVLGVLCLQQLPELPGPMGVLLIVALAAICAALRLWKCLALFAGVLWALGYAEMKLSDRLPGALEGRVFQVEGRIEPIPVYSEKRVRFDFKVSKADPGVPARLRLNWYFPKVLPKAGQYWRFTVKLKRPRGNFNPGNVNYERSLFVSGIGATGYIKEQAKPQLLADKDPLFSLAAWRQKVFDQLVQAMPNADSLGLIQALTLGERQLMSDQQWLMFRKTGTVHLMAISGLHIGLVSGMIYWLVANIWTRSGVLSIAPYQVAACFAFFAALAYSAMAGFAIPTQRALIMLAVFMLALLRQRHVSAINTLAIALLVVVMLDPLAVLSAGFWLSFFAVGIIFYSLRSRLKSGKAWKSALKIHWVTSLALAPLLFFFFQEVSVIAPIANLIAVPWVSFIIIPLCLAGVCLLFIAPSLALAVLSVADSMLCGLIWLLSRLAELPFATFQLAEPSPLALFLGIVGLFVLMSPKGLPGRWLGILMCLPLAFNDKPGPDDGEVELTLLDVGQGLSVVVRTAHHSLVYDAGARFDESADMGSRVVLPYLNFLQIKKLDAVVISHGDNDHIGGAATLLNMTNPALLISSVPEQLAPFQAEFCQAGQSWMWDGVRFAVLSPQTRAIENDNDGSCVLQISSGQGGILLTGDIERKAEAELVATYGDQLSSRVMIAPHHGSKTSSSTVFLKQVNPEIILIPAGYNNRFGFPHKLVLRRYSEQNIKWFEAGKEGAIRLLLKGNAVTVERSRLQLGRYWNEKPER